MVVVQLTGCPRGLRRRTVRLIAMLRNLWAGGVGGAVRAASDDQSLAKQFLERLRRVASQAGLSPGSSDSQGRLRPLAWTSVKFSTPTCAFGPVKRPGKPSPVATLSQPAFSRRCQAAHRGHCLANGPERIYDPRNAGGREAWTVAGHVTTARKPCNGQPGGHV